MNFLGRFLIVSLFGFGNFAIAQAELSGPYATETATYRFPPKIDPDVLSNTPTELWARVFWPKQIESAQPTELFPLILLLHGNHATCSTDTTPKSDVGCQYTHEGTCPSGQTVTLNHEGYNYAAERIASWGYIVASINANRGITCGTGDQDDWGLILARGRLVLKHLQLWSEWNRGGGTTSAFHNSNLFKGHVDIDKVGLMGHSRGGEGVRAAYNLYLDKGSIWPALIPNLNIRAIFEIGAVDGQSSRTLDASNIAWTQLLPLCDGDVSDLEGKNPFERMSKTFFDKTETETYPSSKSLFMVWGANHNFFNTEWQSTDSYSCQGQPTHKPLFDTSANESLAQQSIATQAMTTFFRKNMGSSLDSPTDYSTLSDSDDFFNPSNKLPLSITNQSQVDREYLGSRQADSAFIIEDFSRAPSAGSSGLRKTETSQIEFNYAVDTTPSLGILSWEKPDRQNFLQLNLSSNGMSFDISSFDHLDFRVGRILLTPQQDLKNPVSFRIALVLKGRRLSQTVSLSAYTTLLGPPNDETDLLQTVRIPISDFQSDLAQVVGVRFIFDETEAASLRLAQVRLTKALVPPVRSTAKSSPLTGKLPKIFSWIKSIFTEDSFERVEQVRPGHLRLKQSPVSKSTQLLQQSGFIKQKRGDDLSFDNFSHNLRTHALAKWLDKKEVHSSNNFGGKATTELVIQSQNDFPVMDSLPVLRIGDNLFPVSRYPNNGHTQVLIFSIPRDSYLALTDGAKARVQYGFVHPSRVWDLPEFNH